MELIIKYWPLFLEGNDNRVTVILLCNGVGCERLMALTRKTKLEQVLSKQRRSISTLFVERHFVQL